MKVVFNFMLIVLSYYLELHCGASMKFDVERLYFVVSGDRLCWFVVIQIVVW